MTNKQQSHNKNRLQNGSEVDRELEVAEQMSAILGKSEGIWRVTRECQETRSKMLYISVYIMLSCHNELWCSCNTSSSLHQLLEDYVFLC